MAIPEVHRPGSVRQPAHHIRRLAALVFACALSACAGSSSADNSTNAATSADATTATTTATAAPQSASASPDGSNPCHLPGLWGFDGACTAGVLTAAGGTFVL